MTDYAKEIGGPGPRALVDNGQPVIAWFSSGDASAVATKKALQKYGTERVTVATIPIPAEHDDNVRFREDCARWFGTRIISTSSAEFNDIWDVFEKEGYLRNQYGAPCTRALKRNVREAFAQAGAIQVFGFTAEEQKRATEFAWRNPEIMLDTPLIDLNLGKNDCHAIVSGAGIVIPAMYRLGYQNNNCIGCVKGGMWYWNKVRRDFPEVFDRMAKLERKLDFALLKDRTGGTTKPLFLDELKPGRGRKADEPKVECSVFCQGLENLDNTDLA